MKTSLLLTLSTLVYSYVPNPPARHNRNGLNYKNQEFEYGTGDDRVRTLSSDDRVSVLKLLEIEVAINKSTVSYNIVLVGLMFCNFLEGLLIYVMKMKSDSAQLTCT